MSYSPDTTSRAYKKALRLHNRSKKTPTAETLPILRQQEKIYKQRYPPVSLDGVLDLGATWEDYDEVGHVSNGSTGAIHVEPVGCHSGERPHAKAYRIPDLPGAGALLYFEEMTELWQDSSCYLAFCDRMSSDGLSGPF